eukprot:56100-Alexandrium_andersonii.AAC.1
MWANERGVVRRRPPPWRAASQQPWPGVGQPRPGPTVAADGQWGARPRPQRLTQAMPKAKPMGARWATRRRAMG